MRKIGYSMVEILIVLAIMSILVVVLAPNLLSYMDDLKIIKMENDMRFMKKYALMFYEENSNWPTKISDFMQTTGNTAVNSPWGEPYFMDDEYFYVNIPRSSKKFNFSDNGVLKYYYKEYYFIVDDASVSYKMYPIYIEANPIDNTQYVLTTDIESKWGNKLSPPPNERPGYKWLSSVFNFFFVHNRLTDQLFFFVEANTPNGGDGIIDFELNIEFSDITLIKNYNGTRNVKNDPPEYRTPFYGGIMKYDTSASGDVVSMPYLLDKSKPFKITLQFNYLTATEAFFGFRSGDVSNFQDLGNGDGDNPLEYVGKKYEIIYKK